MELRDIRYFLVLCEELHFTRAADRCGVSQPCISAAIKKIEAELGGVLFHRRPQPRLSELGRVVRPLLEDALRNVEHSLALAQAQAQAGAAPDAPAPAASLADVRQAMARVAAEFTDELAPPTPANDRGYHDSDIVLARLRDSRVVSSCHRLRSRRGWRARMLRLYHGIASDTGRGLAVAAVGLIAVAATGLLFLGLPPGKPRWHGLQAASPEITSSTSEITSSTSGAAPGGPRGD